MLVVEPATGGVRPQFSSLLGDREADKGSRKC